MKQRDSVGRSTVPVHGAFVRDREQGQIVLDEREETSGNYRESGELGREASESASERAAELPREKECGKRAHPEGDHHTERAGKRPGCCGNCNKAVEPSTGKEGGCHSDKERPQGGTTSITALPNTRQNTLAQPATEREAGTQRLAEECSDAARNEQHAQKQRESVLSADNAAERSQRPADHSGQSTEEEVRIQATEMVSEHARDRATRAGSAEQREAATHSSAMDAAKKAAENYRQVAHALSTSTPSCANGSKLYSISATSPHRSGRKE